MTACGSCADCSAAAIDEHQDLLLVANMRMTQRAQAAGRRDPHRRRARRGRARARRAWRPGTFAKLRAQAALQLTQLEAEAAAGPSLHEVLRPQAASWRCPAPSPGDLFFDFEGDPCSTTRASEPLGAGVPLGRPAGTAPDGAHGEFWPLWAHDRDRGARSAGRVPRLRRGGASRAPGHAHLPLRAVRDDRAQAAGGRAQDPRGRARRPAPARGLRRPVRRRSGRRCGSRSRRTASRSSSRSTWRTSRVGEVTRRRRLDRGVPRLPRAAGSQDDEAAADAQGDAARVQPLRLPVDPGAARLAAAQVARGAGASPTRGRADLPEAKAAVDDAELRRAARAAAALESGPSDRVRAHRRGAGLGDARVALGLLPARGHAVLVGALRPAAATEPTSGPTTRTSSGSPAPRSSRTGARSASRRLARRTLRLTGRRRHRQHAGGTARRSRCSTTLPAPDGVDRPDRGRARLRSDDVAARRRRAARRRDGCTVHLVEALSREAAEYDDLPMAVGAGRRRPTRARSQARSATLADEADSRRRAARAAGLDMLLRRPPRLARRRRLPHTGDAPGRPGRGTARPGPLLPRGPGAAGDRQDLPRIARHRRPGRASTAGRSASSPSPTPSWRTCSTPWSRRAWTPT